MKRSPLRRVSKKRQAQLPARRELIDRIHARDVVCQFPRYLLRAHLLTDGFDPGPCRYPLDVHEIIPRSAWRDGWLHDTNCVLVCRAHHEWIDNYPDEAHEIGLHGYSHERKL